MRHSLATALVTLTIALAGCTAEDRYTATASLELIQACEADVRATLNYNLQITSPEEMVDPFASENCAVLDETVRSLIQERLNVELPYAPA